MPDTEPQDIPCGRVSDFANHALHARLRQNSSSALGREARAAGARGAVSRGRIVTLGRTVGGVR